MSKFLVLLTILLVVPLLGCVGDVKVLDCTVRYVDLEGGFYGLVCGDEKYYPINLPEEYKQDGLRVVAVVKPVNVVTAVMWGTPVEVLAIHKI